ncbi:MAG: DNA polymerase III subunit alpha [Chthoniobacterales bacterium]|nr:DNA polymerase III subunit alpha [Chthoniobacterales bacterium]
MRAVKRTEQHRAAVHLDADAFFVGCEVASEPRLRGKAVAVGGMKRGIIASASYEARRLGVYTPMPTARALKICPRLIVLPGDWEKYEHFSRLMFSLVHDYTPVVEVGSIDEGYGDLSGVTKWSPRTAAERLRKNIRDHLRLSVSQGLGTNKLVASVASKLRKPDCFLEVPPGTEREFLAPLEVKWLPGVGTKMERVFEAAGLRCIAQVAAATPESLELIAGSAAGQLCEFARGIDERPIVTERPDAQSYGKQETFDEDTTDEDYVRRVLRGMADHLMANVRADGKMIRCVEVRLRYNDMEQSRRSESLAEPTDLETDVYGLIDRLARRAWGRRVSLRLVGVKFSRVYDAGGWRQAGLDLPGTGYDRETRRRLARVMDEAKVRYGAGSLVRGHQLEAMDSVQCSVFSVQKKPSAGRNYCAHAQNQVSAVLNAKSCFSFMDSLLRPEDIVRMAVERGAKAVAMTDPNLHGAVEFCTAAQEAGIKPIVAAEVKVRGIPYLAYVENAAGYRKLCGLLSGTNKDVLDGLILRPAAAFPEVRYASPRDVKFYEVMQSIRTLSLAGQPHPDKRRGDFSWSRQIGVSPGMLRDTEEIAEKCGFVLPVGGLKFPRFTPPDGSLSRDFLARLAREGMRKRYGAIPSGGVRRQVDEELRIIGEVGYEEYFLVVWELLQRCRERGIDWITRGSAADSLVCYCLGISSVCPVRFELYFRRFLNPERMKLQKLPDIDIDFPHDRRDEVVDLIFERYGPHHAAVVGGFGTYQGRSAFADIAKALGVSEFQIRRMTEKLPQTSARDVAAAAHDSVETRGLTWEENPYQAALRLAARLDGFPRHAKMHPCGVVVSRDPVGDLTPLFISASGRPTTQFDMEAVEAMGLVKLDILAQGGLSVLRDTREALRVRGIEPPDPGTWDDPHVWQMIAEGEARGAHHIESPAMTSLARMSGVRAIDQLIAIVSVIRPGAANSLRKEQFARRARGIEPVRYAHPSLEPVLRSTCGVVAYEEHVLQICEVFAGWDAGRADILRRMLVKNRMANVDAWRAEFAAAARTKGRTDGEIAAVWDLLMQFRGYAFCRAHSTAYGLEAYEAAQLKRYWPAEFLASVLTHGKGFYSRLFYTIEARRLGISFSGPDINGEVRRFSAASAAIAVPLCMIKGLSEELLTRIENARPFASLADFQRRCAPHADEAMALLRAGAFDMLGASRTGQFWELRALVPWNAGQGLLLESKRPALPVSRTEPDRLQKLRDEMELLGFTVSGHPVELFPDIAWDTYCPVRDVRKFDGRFVTTCGLVVAQRLHRQSDGRAMKFISICDRGDILECELFAGAYRRSGGAVAAHPVVEVAGVVQRLGNGTACLLRVERVCRPRSLKPEVHARTENHP